jgi:DNA-binding NtrC family response regulator
MLASIWWVGAAVCLVLSLQLAISGASRRVRAAYFLLALVSALAGATTIVEIRMFTAATAEAFGFWLRARSVLLGTFTVALALLVRARLATGREWIASSAFALIAARVLANMLGAASPVLPRSVGAISKVPLPWGEAITVAVGRPYWAHPASLLVNVLVTTYIIDATLRYRRRGGSTAGVVFGGAIVAAYGVGSLYAVLIQYEVVRAPHFTALLFLPVLVTTTVQLARDAARGEVLALQLAAADQRWCALRENVPLYLLLADGAGRIVYVNPFFTNVTRRSAADLLGRAAAEVVPSALEGVPSDVGAEPRSRSNFGFLDTASGERRNVFWTAMRCSAAAASSPDAAPDQGLLVVGVDDTSRAIAHAERNDALAQLRVALAERDAALAATRRTVTELEAAVGALTTELASTTPGELVATSESMRYVLHRIEQVAPLRTTVLVEGETGVGKEMVARAIHARSPRAASRMVTVNCAGLPPTLIEDELFGHERAAFTGATRARKGRFELASGSTLFLDEVGELPLELQAKLLRALQEGEIERIGGCTTIKVDVRVIAASNRDLARDVERGRFRADLYYRLQAYPLTVPPLRLRKDDIPALVAHFVREHAAAQGKHIDTIPRPVLDALIAFDWPGNVRELRNVTERAVIHTQGSSLRLGERLPAGTVRESGPAGYQGKLVDVERRYVESVLASCGWRIEGPGGAAELLGLHPNTLRHRLGKLGLSRPPRLPFLETAAGRVGGDRAPPDLKPRPPRLQDAGNQ